MSFSTIVDMVRGEFLEMPGLELTEAQAIKLWNLDGDECRYVLDVLVAAGFLQWTTRRTVIRTGRPVTSDRKSVNAVSHEAQEEQWPRNRQHGM
jgi:hypothetical protein